MISRVSQLAHNYPLLFYLGALVILSFLFFNHNFAYGFNFGYADIPFLELEPEEKLWSKFFIWQEDRAFGLELGQESGWIPVLLVFSFLGTFLTPVASSYVYNLALYILLPISVYALTRAIFHERSDKDKIAFFAGLLATTNFFWYITGIHPFLPSVLPIISVALLLSATILYLKTDQKRYVLLFTLAVVANLGSFIGPAFLVIPVSFAVLYMLFHLIVESKRRISDVKKIIFLTLIALSISAPLIFSSAHFISNTELSDSTFFKMYTASVSALNLDNRDNSEMINTLRLIGTGNWDYQALWKDGYAYPYYLLYTTNPLFILATFLVPGLVFGSLLFKAEPSVKKKLAFLGLLGVGYLFLLKGAREPAGDIFRWLLFNVPYMVIFRTPFDKVGMALLYIFSIMGGFAITRILSFTIPRFLVLFRNQQLGSLIQRFKHGVYSLLALMVMLGLMLGLVLQAFPVLSGQFYEPRAFTNIPEDYRELSVGLEEDIPFKVLTLPQIAFSNAYTWGYWGGGIDQWTINKPMIQRSYLGSDVYNERGILAVLDEVNFKSGQQGSPISLKEYLPIFRNGQDKDDINIERVAYFGYLLRQSNVGGIVYHKDILGTDHYTFNDEDLRRFDNLMETLTQMGFVRLRFSGTNVDYYDVLGYSPIVGVAPSDRIYTTPNYGKLFLDSYQQNSRLDILSSFHDYDASYGFVEYAKDASMEEHSTLLVPFSLGAYYNFLLGEENIERAYNPTSPKVLTIREDHERLKLLLVGNLYFYRDYSLLLELQRKLLTNEVPNLDEEIEAIRDAIVTEGIMDRVQRQFDDLIFAYSNKNFNEVKARVNDLLNALISDHELLLSEIRGLQPYWDTIHTDGNYTIFIRLGPSASTGIIESTIKEVQRKVLTNEVPNLDEEIEAIRDAIVTEGIMDRVQRQFDDLIFAYSKKDLPAIKDRLGDLLLLTGIALKQNVFATKTSICCTHTVSILNGDKIHKLEVLELEEISPNWYTLGSMTLTKGGVFIIPTFGQETYFALLLNNPPPSNNISSTYLKLSPVKYIVKVSGATDDFFLNLLVSYNPGWKIYSLGSEPIELGLRESRKSFLDKYDIIPFLKSPILEEKHLILNGFQNSWFVEQEDKVARLGQNVVNNLDGIDDEYFLIYYQPQSIVNIFWLISIIALLMVGLYIVADRALWRRLSNYKILNLTKLISSDREKAL